MARIRTVKPDFWIDSKISQLSDHAALFFIGLWNFCDDYGYFEIDTLGLSKKLPRWRSQDIFKILKKLAELGLVNRSSTLGVGLVNGWNHQRIDRPRVSKWKDLNIQWDTEANSSSVRRTFDASIGKDSIVKERILNTLQIGTEVPGSATVLPISDEVEITKPKKKEKPTLSSQTVKKIYCESFKSRYGSDPAWAAKENRLANTLIASVGLENAFRLAEYYPTYIDPWHVKQRHPFALLVSQYHKVLTDMQNVKHVVDARLHEKNFDEKVEDYEHKVKIEHLKQQSELAGIAFEWAKREHPDLLDYKFQYEEFLRSKNISPETPYQQLKVILRNNNLKALSVSKEITA